jgi:hypothetical protein
MGLDLPSNFKLGGIVGNSRRRVYRFDSSRRGRAGEPRVVDERRLGTTSSRRDDFDLDDFDLDDFDLDDFDLDDFDLDDFDLDDFDLDERRAVGCHRLLQARCRASRRPERLN